MVDVVLPESIIQHIQSLMAEEKDAVRSCLLSKSWSKAWSTRPALTFHQLRISSVDLFVKSVNDTLVRYRHHNLLVESFHLTIKISLDLSLVDEWLRQTSTMGVKVLRLEQEEEEDNEEALKYIEGREMKKYVLDSKNVFAAETLKELHINTGWLFLKLGTPDDLLMNNMVIIKCHNLVKLVLVKVKLKEKLLQNIFFNCRLLEEVAIEFCRVIEEIKVPNFLDHLKHLKIKLYGYWQTVQIDSNIPSTVQSMIFYINARPLFVPCTLSTTIFYLKGFPTLRWREWIFWKMIEAKNLRHLELTSTHITDLLLNDSIPNLVFLNKLRLEFCMLLENINIVSTSLENLELMHCNRIQNLEINCPNLQRFEYELDGHMWPQHISCSNCNTKYQLLVKFSLYCERSRWIYGLRRLLETAGGHDRTNISINVQGICYLSDDINLEQLQLEAFSMPAAVNKLKLTLDQPRPLPDSLSASIVDILFSICHPNYIICYTSRKSQQNNYFIKVLTKQLMIKTKKPPSSRGRRISGDYFQRWRHRLKGVKARPGVHVDGSDDDWYPLQLMSKSKLVHDSTATFRLNW